MLSRRFNFSLSDRLCYIYSHCYEVKNVTLTRLKAPYIQSESQIPRDESKGKRNAGAAGFSLQSRRPNNA